MESSHPPFGLIVAYLLPGFIGLGGVVLFIPSLKQWMEPVAYQGAAGIAPPIYAVLAAIAFGMILSCFRWLLIDHIHQWTGVKSPVWSSYKLNDQLGAFNYLVEHHYRYYQFYANTLIAVLWTYTINRVVGSLPMLGLSTDLTIVVLCIVLFAGSRDALLKYYDRTKFLISEVAEKKNEGDVMTNGCHRDQVGGTSTNKQPDQKSDIKKEVPKKESVKTPASRGK